MTTRREALTAFGAIATGLWRDAPGRWLTGALPQDGPTPPLAPGAPNSPERLALIEAFKQKSAGVDALFEPRTFKGDWTMPYRLFHPTPGGRVPLVVFLHGSGGLGDDNVKQMGLGNVFGTRVCALPENQKRFPCYVVAPQTDRGWINYGPATPGDSVARPIPGLGDGTRLAFAMIDALCRELPIDTRRIYLTGQSMGGRGVWHMTAQRPKFFAASVPCCAGPTFEPATASATTPVWAFHGEVDQTEPATFTRDRIAALRGAGIHPLYTEYAGVDHNVWEWAYTEPALLTWLFSKRRAG